MSFFENRQINGQTLKPRQVYEFTLPDRALMALGGIYSIWINPRDTNDRRLSCSIITVEPNPVVGEIHNRMPFIVPPELVSRWLDRSYKDGSGLKQMIRPHDGRLDAGCCVSSSG